MTSKRHAEWDFNPAEPYVFHAKSTHALISARIVITTLNYQTKLPQMLKHHGRISVCLLAL